MICRTTNCRYCLDLVLLGDMAVFMGNKLSYVCNRAVNSLLLHISHIVKELNSLSFFVKNVRLYQISNAAVQ